MKEFHSQLVMVDEKSPPLHFYEKVIKVKADVAALHIFFSDINEGASGGGYSCLENEPPIIVTLSKIGAHNFLHLETFPSRRLYLSQDQVLGPRAIHYAALRSVVRNRVIVAANPLPNSRASAGVRRAKRSMRRAIVPVQPV
jgi:hypothetical protein